VYRYAGGLVKIRVMLVSRWSRQHYDPRQSQPPTYSTPRLEEKGGDPDYSHKWIIHGDDEDLAGILEFGRVYISRNVVLRARRGEGGWDACKQYMQSEKDRGLWLLT
jgi:hypothetical protein